MRPRHHLLSFSAAALLAWEGAHYDFSVGVQVTLVTKHGRILDSAGPDIAAALAEALREVGVKITSPATVPSVEKGGASKFVTLRTKNRARNSVTRSRLQRCLGSQGDWNSVSREADKLCAPIMRDRPPGNTLDRAFQCQQRLNVIVTPECSDTRPSLFRAHPNKVDRTANADLLELLAQGDADVGQVVEIVARKGGKGHEADRQERIFFDPASPLGHLPQSQRKPRSELAEALTPPRRRRWAAELMASRTWPAPSATMAPDCQPRSPTPTREARSSNRRPKGEPDALLRPRRQVPR